MWCGIKKKTFSTRVAVKWILFYTNLCNNKLIAIPNFLILNINFNIVPFAIYISKRISPFTCKNNIINMDHECTLRTGKLIMRHWRAWCSTFNWFSFRDRNGRWSQCQARFNCNSVKPKEPRGRSASDWIALLNNHCFVLRVESDLARVLGKKKYISEIFTIAMYLTFFGSICCAIIIAII